MTCINVSNTNYGTTSHRKKHDLVKQRLRNADWTKRFKSYNYINMSNSNWAAHKYLTRGKRHDPVNHLGLGNSDWTERLKSNVCCQHIKCG